MGSMVQPVCDCNTPFKVLLLGGGFLNFSKNCSVPCSCENCGTITEKNILKPKQKCNKCKNPLEYFGELITENNTEPFDDENYVFTWRLEEIDKVYVLRDELYNCPKCKSQKLKFYDVGCWD